VASDRGVGPFLFLIRLGQEGGGDADLEKRGQGEGAELVTAGEKTSRATNLSSKGGSTTRERGEERLGHAQHLEKRTWEKRKVFYPR